MRHSYLFIFVLIALGGCGIKPGSLEPPPGSQEKPYPATYPAPSTLDSGSY